MIRDQNASLSEFTEDDAGDSASSDSDEMSPAENAEAIATLLDTVEELTDQVTTIVDELETEDGGEQASSIDTKPTDDRRMFQ